VWQVDGKAQVLPIPQASSCAVLSVLRASVVKTPSPYQKQERRPAAPVAQAQPRALRTEASTADAPK